MPRLASFHFPALIYLALTAFMALAAMNTQNNLLFWVFGIMVAAFILSWLLATLAMWSVQVRRMDPRHGSMGQPLIVRYATTNRSHWLSIFNLQVQESPSEGAGSWTTIMPPARAWIMHIAPRETVHGEAIFWPQRRGQVAFERMRLWTTFPFGIVRMSRIIRQPQHTLIYPKMFELRRGLLRSVTPPGLMGARISSHAGAGDDYYGVRDHRAGDSMRHIAWKRTARTDELVTIERARPSPAKLRVVLDLSTPANRPPVINEKLTELRELQEQAISLAASILHAADLDGFEIGLTILGPASPPPPIAVRRNRWHFHKMLAALAQIDLEAPHADPAAARRELAVHDFERVGHVVIAPDRIEPLAALPQALYLTARQLTTLAAPVDAKAVPRRSAASSHNHGVRFAEQPA